MSRINEISRVLILTQCYHSWGEKFSFSQIGILKQLELSARTSNCPIRAGPGPMEWVDSYVYHTKSSPLFSDPSIFSEWLELEIQCSGLRTCKDPTIKSYQVLERNKPYTANKVSRTQSPCKGISWYLRIRVIHRAAWFSRASSWKKGGFGRRVSP